MTLTFDEPLDAGSVPATRAFAVVVGESPKVSVPAVTHVAVAGNAALLTLAEGSAVAPGQAVRVSYRLHRPQPLRDPAGNLVETFLNTAAGHAPAGAPRVLKVRVTSTPELSSAGPDGTLDTYGPGETIRFSVAFSAEVTATGAPEFVFALGAPGASDSARRAARVAGRGGATVLVFAYTVQPADVDADGISWAADALAPGAGGIAAQTAGRTAAVASHPARGPLPGHRVDGSRSAPPALASAEVDGTVLTLRYEEALDAGSVPAPGDFTVRIPTVSQTGETLTLLPDVDAVTVAGDEAVLTLRQPVRFGATAVTLEYVPGAHPLRDAAGNDAEGFERLEVVNLTKDTEAPVLDPPLTVNGDRLTLTWNEPLDKNSVPAPGDFTVLRSVSGEAVKVDVLAVRIGVEMDGEMDYRKVELRLEEAVRHVSQVKAGYTPPRANPLKDPAGNAAPGFAPRRVDNRTPDPAAPAGPGTAVSATVNGTALTLTFGAALDAGSVPATGDFTVRVPHLTASGERLTLLPDVDLVAVEGHAAVLTLRQPVRHGETATVSYTPGATPLRVRGGDPVPGFAGRAVDNMTPDTEAPRLDPPLTVTSDRLTLSWNEPLDPASVPDPDNFTVERSVSDTPVPAKVDVDELRMDGRTVVLWLAEMVLPVWQLKAGYTPGEIPVQDAAGNAAPGFELRRVTHVAPGTGVPVLARPPTVTGNELTLTWSEPLDHESVPDREDFTVERWESGTPVKVDYATADGMVKPVEVEGRRVVLRLAQPALPEWLLKVSYTPDAQPVRDLAGNAASAFVWREVEHMAALLQSAAPSVTGLPTVTAPAAGPDDGYAAGERIEARVAFDAPVDVDTTLGRPALGLALGGVRRDAAYEGGSGTAVLSFALEVAEGDAGAAEARAIANGLVLNGATDAALAFGEAPGIVSVTVAPDADGDGTWGVGEAVEAALVFAEPVAVDSADGTPSLRALVGSTERALVYARGSGSDTLVFAWTVTRAGGAAASVLVLPDSLALNGGAIRSTAGLDALIAHDGAALAGAVRRSPPALGVEDAAAAEGETLAFRVTLTPAAAGPVTVDWATADGPAPNGATAGADYTAASGTLTFAAGESERTVEVAVLADGVAEGAETLTLTLSNPVGARIDDGAAAGTIAASADADGRAAFTASFSGVPPEHDGAGAFTLTLAFGAEPAGLSYKTVRDSLFTVTGGALTKARRLAPPSNRRYELTVEPDGNAAVVLALASPLPACGAAGSVCTADGRALSGALSATVPGPAALSVADAAVHEAPGAVLAFRVSLDRTRHAAVTVDYATADGVAKAGSDYTAASGTLVFAVGETERTVEVAVLDDSEDEGSETMTLRLSNPVGARIADGEATGTIENSDAMPQAWLARFGRTVAEQAIEAVEGRFAASRAPGVEVTLAGERIGGAAPDAEALEEEAARAKLAALGDWLAGDARETDDPGRRSRAVSERELLTGSSFALTGEPGGGGGIAALWGRGAISSFDGRAGSGAGALTLSGEVTSAMLGADWTRGPWTAGLLLSHSRGTGSYRGASSGKVESALTGLYPYGRYAVNPRLSVWGIAGYGAGTLTLTPDGEKAIGTDMDLMMGAVGVRGVALEAPAEGGVELAVKSDALAVRTRSEAVRGKASGSGSNLAAATADVTRLRLGLEGTWRGLKLGSGELVPRLEVGVRHDGGDAETGFGLDLGGGLAWSDAKRGIRAELRGRGLLTHESRGFRDRGVSGALTWEPGAGTGTPGRGPKLTLSQTLGGAASGGADALLGRGTLEGLAANDAGAGSGASDLKSRRLELKLGYGFSAFGDRFTSTPEIGVGLSDTGRDYRLGWRLTREARAGGSLELSLEATRRESANDNADPEHGIGFRLTARF